MKKTVQETLSFPNVFNTYVLVAYRHEIRKDKPICKTIMGMNVIVVEDASGNISVLDAYCPHMGAPLSEGRFVDDCIVCPFHSMKFNVEGERLSEKGQVLKKQTTRVYKYPTVVMGEFIFAWFDEDQKNAQPLYQIPDITYSELHRMRLRPYAFFDIEMECVAQIPFENTADASHFESVHHNLKAERQKPEDYGYDPAEKIWRSKVQVSGYTFYDKAGIDFDFPHHVVMWGPNNILDDIPFRYSANAKLAPLLPQVLRKISVLLPIRVTILAVPVTETKTIFRLTLGMQDHKYAKLPVLKYLFNRWVALFAKPLARWEFSTEGRKVFGPKVTVKSIDHLPSHEYGPMKLYREYCALFYRREGLKKYQEDIATEKMAA